MNLHEYQAKRLFADYGLPVPRGVVVRSSDEAIGAISTLGSENLVVKAQVHAGGRGKAGGVKLVKGRDELAEVARELLFKNLVTYQTTEAGQPINELLIEELSQIDKELYLGAVLDRATSRVVIMASTEGGVDIETVAHNTPEKILKITVDPLLGVLPYQCRELGFKLGLNLDQIKQFTTIVVGLGKMFVECDLTLVEVNPLIITKDGRLVCLDGKVNIDDNAMFRHPKLNDLRDARQEDEREIRAREWELNYIPLDGNIGCMVNGAGLAMATMDLIKLHGGDPANFLDVGGGATKERVCEAFKIILSDKNVKGVLVNIFGGIVRCDLIAEGILGAVAEVGITIPVVVRLEGNRAQEASEVFKKSSLNIIAANDLTQAAKTIVDAVKVAK
ncbi:ADP-forming succinate--CoA ligase subunit beta [Candidatus Berkiella aquae]|uniref:Succinate--CoA ligase [ADP-forming] subunit beta n=1 Tax=Candidatus Berkiella aquae TaxID=295108 RepID=A0A0Q9YP69_9GAMM|nr:ADP-forming succinate--CoA ligase subunit beta [Candidatus Berkiella aquae]MCS5712046.1 ADP-forming succinate--CoA ligase subunit beta [Candidatus Berkiella aquae]